MAGKASNYLENELLDHLTDKGSWSPPATYYIALSKADPTDDASGLSEPSGGDYARADFTSADWNNAASRASDNANDITFNTATADWSTAGDPITHWAIMDAASGGNMLIYGEFDSTHVIEEDDVFTVPAGNLEISVDSGGWSDYLANAFLDHFFGKSTFTAPSNLYVGLSRSNPLDTGLGYDYPIGNSYDRVSTASGDWDAAASGIADNNTNLTFPEATGSWGTISHAGTFDVDLDTDYAILDIDASNDQIVISGDQTSKIEDGSLVRVRDSWCGHDNVFSVASTSYDGGPDETTITVDQDVASCGTPTPTPGGFGYLDIMGNMLTYGSLASSKSVGSSEVFRFATGDFDLTLD